MISIKRTVDVIFSILAILIFSPFIPIFAALIKLDSKGPVLYLTDRVGKNTKPFKMYKFRTMLDVPYQVGESVCARYDPRVTSFGRFLRRTKLNEIPQFLNILKGDMTFVGPRPEAPDLAALYPDNAKVIFTVKPGLVGPATIMSRNEEELYPTGVDTKLYYIESILPDKLILDREYIDNQSIFKDFIIIFYGIKETIFGTLNKRHLLDNLSQMYLMFLDLILMSCSFFLAFYFYYFKQSAFHVYPIKSFSIFFIFFSISLLIRFILNAYFGLYSSLIRYISIDVIKSVIKSVIFSSMILIIISFFFKLFYLTTPFFVLDFLLLISLLSTARLTLKYIWDRKNIHNLDILKKRTLIYGAGDEGRNTLLLILSNKYIPYEILGFVDDSSSKIGKIINGKKVLGNRHHLKELIKLYRIEVILIANPKISKNALGIIFDLCQKNHIEYKYINPIKAIFKKPSNFKGKPNVDLSSLLRLKFVQASYNGLNKSLNTNTILLFGTAGSLGLELCEKLLRIGCKKLIIIECYESYLNEFLMNISMPSATDKIVPVLNASHAPEKIESVFAKYHPDIVLHAGMRKFETLYSVEYSNALRLNYSQTFSLAKISLKYRAKYFITLSSILDGYGESIICDSLKVSDQALKHFFSSTNTIYSIVRLADIAENRGGIVSNIKDQVISNKQIVLPDIYRKGFVLLMSKTSAATFLLNTLSDILNNNSNGNDYKCDAVTRYDIEELVTKLALFYGFNDWNNINFKFNGNDFNTQKLFERRKTQNDEFKLLINNLNKNCKPGDIKKIILTDFINNELDKNIKYHFRTKDLLEICES